MSHFTLIASDLPIRSLLAELDARPGLWNTRPERRVSTSPHREADDLWLRYAAPEVYQTMDYQAPHVSVWWPAIHALPSVLDIVNLIREKLGGPLQLGGVLMTRIPPGCRVYEHHDRGTFHAHYYDCKVWVVLKANEHCVNTVEDEEMVWRPGEGWQHDNLIPHSVRNEGDTERVVLILCFRRG